MAFLNRSEFLTPIASIIIGRKGENGTILDLTRVSAWCAGDR